MRSYILLMTLFTALLGTSRAATLNAVYGTATDVPLTAAGYTATGKTVAFTLGFMPVAGSSLTVIRNTAPGFIIGEFSNLRQGQAADVSYNGTTYHFVANYHGGATGRDLVLAWAHTAVAGWGADGYGETGATTPGNIPQPVPLANQGVLAGKTVVSLATGGNFSVALTADGTLAAWGINHFGQLGDGSQTDSSVPVAVDTSGALAGKTVVAIAAGNVYALALCADGTLVGWGDAEESQLNNPAVYPFALVPVAVPRTGALAGRRVVSIAAGAGFCLALCSDGVIAGWGYNDSGQLGTGTLSENPTVAPVAVRVAGTALAGRRVLGVEARGNGSAAAWCTDGSVCTWGDNTYGALGNGGSNPSAVPVLVSKTAALRTSPVISMAGGAYHCLALCANAEVIGWGYDNDQELGSPLSDRESKVPVSIGPFSPSVAALGGSIFSGLALLRDGSLRLWGSESNDGWPSTDSTHVVSTAGLPAGARFALVSRGSSSDHYLATYAVPEGPDIPHLVVRDPKTGKDLDSGTTVDLGRSTVGRTVTRSFVVTNTGTQPLNVLSLAPSGPDQVDFSFKLLPWQPLNPGDTATLQITLVAGTPNAESATLQITSNDPVAPAFNLNLATDGMAKPVLTAAYNTATDIAVTAAAYTATGKTVNLALNFAPPVGTTLTVVRNTGLNFIQGEFNNLAQGQAVDLTFNGTVYHFVANYFGGPSGRDLVLVWANTKLVTWGINSLGLNGAAVRGLSPGSSLPQPLPGEGVLAGRTVTSVAVASDHMVALCADGTVAAWNGTYDVLGTPLNAPATAPVAVDTTGALVGKTVAAISAVAGETLALCSDSTLVAWGPNAGQGSGTLPVQIPLGGALAAKKAVAISVSPTHHLVLFSDGTLAAWGQNQYGELGLDPPVASSATPLPVPARGALKGKAITAIAAGSHFSAALCSDGTIALWGQTTGGRAPVPVTADRTGVLKGKKVAALSAGGGHLLALCSDGTPAALGGNHFGQLGAGVGTAVSWPPLAVDQTGSLRGHRIVSFSGGATHSLALCTDGTLEAWGANDDGQLGNTGSGNNQYSAVPVMTGALPAGAQIVAAVTGPDAVQNIALVAMPDATTFAGPTIAVNLPYWPTPTASVPTLDFGKVPTGQTPTKTFQVTNTGSAPLQISSVQIIDQPQNTGIYQVVGFTPQTVAPGASTPVTISYFRTPVTTGNQVTQNVLNWVVVIASNDASTPLLQVNLSATGDAASGSLDADFVSATEIWLTTDGYTAENGLFGLSYFRPTPPPVGTSLTVIHNTGPAPIQGTFINLDQGATTSLPITTYVPLVANYHAGPRGNDLVLQWANTMVVAWGNNYSCQLGNNRDTRRTIPVPVDQRDLLFGKTALSIGATAVGGSVLCADGTIATWGGFDGPGVVSQVPGSKAPVQLSMAGQPAGRKVVALAQQLALCDDGALITWGYGYYGRLGNNSLAPSASAVTVDATGALAGKTVTAISSSGHCMALCSDGTVVAWGYNGSGQLGDGTTTNRSAPVAVPMTGALAGKTVVQVAAGGEHSLALCADGTVAAWGLDTQGQLGDGGSTSSSVPVSVDMSGVLAGRQILALAAGGDFSLALLDNGTVASWGGNDSGQLGNATTTPSAVPVLVNTSGVLASRKVTAISAGSQICAVLCADGSAVTWGSNMDGALGINDSVPAFSPIPVLVSMQSLPPGAVFTAISCEVGHCEAIVGLPASLPQTNPVRRTAGTYSGLVTAQAGTTPGNETEGCLTTTVQSSGSFTGKLSMGGGSYGFSGSFDASGIAHFGTGQDTSLTINRFPKVPLVLALSTWQFSTPLSTLLGQAVVGTVTQQERAVSPPVSVVRACRVRYDGLTTDTTPPGSLLGSSNADGVFNLIFPVLDPRLQPVGFTILDYPQATGFATARISKTGSVTLSGTLADGTAFTAATMFTDNTGPRLSATATHITTSTPGQEASHPFIPVYASLYNGGGFMSTQVYVNQGDALSDLSAGTGQVNWARPAMDTQAYPLGWPEVIATDLLGAKYTPVPGSSVLPGIPGGLTGRALLQVSGSTLTNSYFAPRYVSLSTADFVTHLPASDTGYSLAINRTTGLISGTATFSDGTRPSFQGIIYPKGFGEPGSQAGGHGFLLTPTPKVKDYTGQSGVMSLTSVVNE